MLGDLFFPLLSFPESSGLSTISISIEDDIDFCPIGRKSRVIYPLSPISASSLVLK